MTEQQIVRNCAPTLAGMKTGSMFTCPYRDKQILLAFTRQFNIQYRAKGLRMIPLRFSEEKALLYVYRPSKLSEDLSKPFAVDLLKNQGYDTKSCQSCIVQLIRKLQGTKDFPHEVGLFLGYPPEDVLGFIEQGPCGCKCSGCWKVYHDVEGAKKTFAKYKKCTSVYCDRHARGVSMSRLTVSDS